MDNQPWEGTVRCWRQQMVDTVTANYTVEFIQEMLAAQFGYGGEINAKTPQLEDSLGVWHITNVPFGQGAVCFKERVFDEAHVSIVQELTEALSLGYLRFLDFQQLEQQAELQTAHTQKAEEQADSLAVQSRELSVEQQLEKVRTQVAEMVKGEDLFLVSGVIDQALTELGVSFFHTGLNVIDEDLGQVRIYGSGDSWIGHKQGVGAGFDLKLFSESLIGKELISHWREGTIWHRLLGKGDMERAIRHLEGTNLVTSEILNAIGEEHSSAKWVADVPFMHGTLSLSRLESEGAFSEVDIRLLERFTEVFALGYRRYLELETAEQQTEQARRERAVERVRAEAMAVRGSEDLLKVVAVVYQEMNKLGIETPLASIVLIDEDRDQWMHYMAKDNSAMLAGKSSPPWVTAYDKNTMVGIEPKLSNSIKEMDDWTKGLFESWKNGVVIAHAISSPKAKGYSSVVVPFEDGWVGYLQKGRNEEQETIVREIAQAFSLGYVRYLDFQKVDEEQKNLIDELEDELQMAHTLQMGLMPTESPQIEGFDITGRCIPANHVGGDFFQYFQQDGKLSVCMADVTGHAMEAAVPVMMFSGILETEMRLGNPLDELFGHLNQTLEGKFDKRTYVCFTMIELDLADRRLQLANSGCPYPYHYHSSTGEVTELQVHAYPLGVRADTAYTAIETSLETGDYIVFCSDGIIEATNAQEEMFGFEQTEETIQTACAEGLSAEGLIDRLIGAVQEFAGDEPQGDDMTCVVLKVEA
jgi:serine phosphatase RsbU (regulator of sigma subunit)